MHWDLAVFLNFSQDHLDYHKTLDHYFASKSLLFSRELVSSEKEDKLAVLNFDDSRIYGLSASEHAGSGFKVISFSEKSEKADACMLEKSVSLRGLSFKVNLKDKGVASIQSKLSGEYNVSNLLALVAILSGIGWSIEQIESTIPKLNPVPGRLERIEDSTRAIFVDYAHTPDALDRVARSLKKLTEGRLIVVFGCGGDRDKAKRALMARAVEETADFAVVTSDNPRTENPDAIISDIVGGFSGLDCFGYKVLSDRRAAIDLALELGQAGDTILVAGKGHEDYQEINGVKEPFDDRIVLQEALGEKTIGS